MGDYDLSFNVGVGGTTLDGSVYVREQTGGCTTYAPGLKVSDFPSMPMPTTTKNLIAEIGKRVKKPPFNFADFDPALHHVFVSAGSSAPIGPRGAMHLKVVRMHDKYAEDLDDNKDHFLTCYVCKDAFALQADLDAKARAAKEKKEKDLKEVAEAKLAAKRQRTDFVPPAPVGAAAGEGKLVLRLGINGEVRQIGTKIHLWGDGAFDMTVGVSQHLKTIEMSEADLILQPLTAELVRQLIKTELQSRQLGVEINEGDYYYGVLTLIQSKPNAVASLKGKAAATEPVLNELLELAETFRVKHGEILQTSHGRGKHGIPQHRLSGIGRNRIRRIAWLDCGRASIEQRLQQVAAKLGQLESRRNMFVHLVGGNLLKQSCHFETNSNFL